MQEPVSKMLPVYVKFKTVRGGEYKESLLRNKDGIFFYSNPVEQICDDMAADIQSWGVIH